MRRPIPALLATAVVGSGLVAAGCGSSSSGDKADAGQATAATPAAMTTSASKANAAAGASDLRATLTALLEDHVHLASITIATGLGQGLDSKQFKAAAGTLDQNSQALAGAIGSVYGDAAGKQFLALWRKHIGFFVSYAKAVKTHDGAAKAKAKAQLDGYRKDFGAFIASANPYLPATAVAKELKPHVHSLELVIDAAAAGKPSTYAKIRAAAMHMPMTAKVLATGISRQKPDQFGGSAVAPAADLRATLTGLLEDHVYLAADAVSAAYSSGLKSKAFTAAAGTLDKNSQALAGAIGSVYGDAAGKQFLALWRKHIGFFVNYAKGEKTGDAALSKKALSDLDGYRADFGAFIASANPNLTKEAVADELKGHVQTLSAAIADAAKGSTGTYAAIQKAASHMPMTADVLAGAIAKQFPDKFPAS